jgi:transcriptional regulator with PAS, ATPase and Fis domain
MAIARGMAAELTKLLSAAATPIYLLDDSRRIVYCNAACAAWLELPAEEILGRACVYASSADAIADPFVARLAGLCPPPEAFAGVRSVGLISCTTNDGRLNRRRAEFIPLAVDTESTAAVLAIAEPHEITSGTAGADDTAGHETASDESARLHGLLQKLHHELRHLRQIDRLVGDSPAMTRVRAQVQLAAAGAATVLVAGPVGSGRQHVARAVHYARRDADASSFVPLSCALLGVDLLRSTLAVILGNDGPQAPRTGTLLLNDVHELPPEVQAELAGYLKTSGVPIRIISTSIAPLDELAAANRFRADLAAALSTVVIHLPPLAERREDIPLLAQALLEEINAGGEKQLRGFSPESLDQLAAYSWPGNIDELSAAVRHAHAEADTAQITPTNLPKRIHLAAAAGRLSRRTPQPIELENFLAQIERELIDRAMRLAKGNKTKAARLLSLTRPRLYRRMVQLGLEQDKPPRSTSANGEPASDDDEINMFDEEE